MGKASGILVGVHFNKFTGGPGRLDFFPRELKVVPRKKSPFFYSGTLTIVKKRTEPFFANHWIQLDLPDGPVWLTCSKKRARAVAEEAKKVGLTVEWPSKA